MDINMFAEVCEKLPKPILKKFKIEMDTFKWHKSTSIDLNEFKVIDVEELSKLLKPMVYEKDFKVKEANIAYKDIQIWLRTRKKGGVTNLKARNCYTFFTLLVAFMRKVPGHRLYLKDADRGVFHSYFVDEIKHHPKRQTSYGEVPAYTNISCMCIDFGIVREHNFSFDNNDCFGLKVEEILLNSDLFAETEELRATYLEEKKRFDIIHPKVGKQYLATGVATNDTDSDDDDDEDWKREKSIFLSREGQPANVVIDVFFETDKKEREDKNANINKTFWLVGNNTDDTDKGDEVDPSEITGKPEEIEIPIHPFLSCFDLRRHMRLKIHVTQLDQYKYDHALGDKLVLPKEHRVLIDSLVSANGAFKDVIKGKAGGSVIICTGGPGLGKTLTSEVYSEVVKRPLYSVQCSQLGTDPDEIEKNILKIFRRAKRWKAILLLDEADVYIHKRGNDLQQNAIVGVFLRTLEYYNGVMFLTTNRGDVVDDAILSRCIARVDYKIPLLEDQKKIWRIQADNNKVKLSDEQIDKIVEKYQNLSGRDIKNLLKLSMMVSSSNGTKVSEKTIFLVKKFKPTADLEV